MHFRYSYRKMAKLFANIGDPDQMPCSATSDLGLHCLPINLLGLSRLQWVNRSLLSVNLTQSCWTRICTAFANSVDPDPDQLASQKPTDLDLHCLPLSMWIYINNLDQVIWLAEN